MLIVTKDSPHSVSACQVMFAGPPDDSMARQHCHWVLSG